MLTRGSLPFKMENLATNTYPNEQYTNRKAIIIPPYMLLGQDKEDTRVSNIQKACFFLQKKNGPCPNIKRY